MARLTNLQARSVRGLPRTWRDVKVGSHGLLVYGPNGVGKSSLIDAIEFTLKGTTSLFPETRQGVSWEKACQHVIDGAIDLAVSITMTGKAHTIAAGADLSTLSEEATAWLAAARAANFVLRRHMLLGFIGKAPKDRYAAVEPFLNLDRYEVVELATKANLEKIKTEIATASTETAQVEHRLMSTLGVPAAAHLDDNAVFNTLNAILPTVGCLPCQDEGELASRHAEVVALMVGTSGSERLTRLAGLRAAVQGVGTAVNLLPLIISLHEATKSLEREITDRTVEVYTDLLLTGRQAIAASKADTCPLCEQEIDRVTVLARLDARIDDDRRVSEARAVVQDRIRALRSAALAVKYHATALAQDWGTIISTPLPKPHSAIHQLLTDMTAALEAGTPNAALVAEWICAVTNGPVNTDDLIAALEATIAAEGGERQTMMRQTAAKLHAAQIELPVRRGLTALLRDLRQREIIAAALHGHAIDARKAAVQAVLSDIADLAGQYYEYLHPGENIGNPKLTVRQTGQGSVELATMFHGCEAPPLLHYSESHLDTLGLCFFLAIRKREAQKNPAFTLLMLDDVLHSVDADHRGRFAELLRDKFADHQLIITTHDPIFFTKLRQTLTGTFARLSLNGWDIKRGPSPSDSSSDLDVVLAEDKASMAPENLAAAAGRLCEWLLRTLAERLQVSIVARFETRHTIGDLWPPVAKKLRENKGFMAVNPALVDDLEKSYWVRNEVGAHYNDSPIPPTPGEVLEFAAALAMLYSATHCSSCRSVTAKRSNDYWSCTCGSLRYGRKDTALSEKITEPV